MKTEAIVTQILEDVIGVKNVDRDARFLDIGGNSQNLVQVLKEIKEKTGTTPPPRMFFDKSNSSIASISAAIESQLEERQSATSAAE